MGTAFTFVIRLWLNHEEYEDEVVSALHENEFLNIESVSLVEDLTLVVQCRICEMNADRFLFYSALNSWVNSLGEAVNNVEVDGLFLQGENKISFNSSSGYEKTLLAKKSLKLAPKNEQGEKELVKHKLLHQHIIDRDGDKCCICQNKFSFENMQSIMLFKPESDPKYSYSSKTEYKKMLSVGICALCRTDHMTTVNHLANDYVSSPLFRYREKFDVKKLQNHFDRIKREYPYLGDDLQSFHGFIQTAEVGNKEAYQKYVDFLTEKQKQDKKQQRRKAVTNKFELIFKRDGSRACCWCRKPFDNTRPPTFEHLIARYAGGSDHIDNLLAACEECNNQRGSQNVYIWFEKCLNKNYLPNFEAICLQLSKVSSHDNQVSSFSAAQQLEELLVYYIGTKQMRKQLVS